MKGTSSRALTSFSPSCPRNRPMCPQTFVFRHPLPCHLRKSQVLRWGGQRVAECLPSLVLHSFLVSQPDTWARSLQRTVCCPAHSPVTHGPSRLLAAALEGCMCVSVCLCLYVLCAHVCVSVSMCVLIGMSVHLCTQVSVCTCARVRLCSGAFPRQESCVSRVSELWLN